MFWIRWTEIINTGFSLTTAQTSFNKNRRRENFRKKKLKVPFAASCWPNWATSEGLFLDLRVLLELYDDFWFLTFSIHSIIYCLLQKKTQQWPNRWNSSLRRSTEITLSHLSRERSFNLHLQGLPPPLPKVA
jgi:hypothetical protein